MIRVDSENQAIKLAWHILNEVQNISFIKDHPSFEITLSVGVAFAEELDNLETLIKKADGAMYIAKQSGRNQVATHNSKTL